MMMALRAFHPDSEEDLPHKGTGFDRLALIPKNHSWAILVGAALGCEQFAHKLIVRFVLAETIPQPKIQEVDRLHTDAR